MTVNVTKPQINLRDKLSEVDKPSGIAGEAILRSETPQEVFNYIGAGRRNLLINGAFEVFQRGAGPASPSSSNSPSSADKWNIPNTSEVSEVVANDRSSHLTKMLKVTANSSGYGQVAQWVENVRTAAGQSLTVSFWAKSPDVGPLRFHIYQNFGSGGSSTVVVIDDSSYFNIDVANTWQRFETTIEIPSVTGKTIGTSNYLAIQTGAPSAIPNRVVYYSEFQAELGKVATPFEHRSYGEELALCQRYYEAVPIAHDQYWTFATPISTTALRGAFAFSEKRASPSVSFEDTTTFINPRAANATISATTASARLVRFNFTSTSLTVGEAQVVLNNTGNTNYIYIDSEL